MTGVQTCALPIYPDTGDVASLGNLIESTYSIEIVPGTYDFVYSVGGGGDGVPHNTNATLECVRIE